LDDEMLFLLPDSCGNLMCTVQHGSIWCVLKVNPSSGEEEAARGLLGQSSADMKACYGAVLDRF